jgi:predicted nucleic acid-binding protein
MAFNGVFVDTNVLIYHTFALFDVDKHKAVKKQLQDFAQLNTDLHISRQVLREFFAISTNAKFFDEPLTTDEACQLLSDFSQAFSVLDDAQIPLLNSLLTKYQINKQKVHDTNLVATMIQSGVSNLYTFNVKDFKLFSEINLVKSD